MSPAWLSLGSNLDNPVKQIKTAIATIKRLQTIDFIKTSSLYSSKAWGNIAQADFVNAVVKIKTSLTPFELLAQCRQLEDQQQRVRHKRWGPRTLDIDILLIDDVVMDAKKLTIPHPFMHERAFVLVPLAEISKNIMVPGHNKTAYELMRRTDSAGIKKLAR